MGYELNRIMKQYGVSTPGMVNYSGTTAPSVPTAPSGSRVEGEDAAAKASQVTYDKQLADFNAYKADPAAFNEAMRKYGLDQKSYDTYKTEYQNRLQNTPMYAQSQFQTGNQSSSSNTLTPEIAINLMHRSMTTGAPTSEFDRYGGYDAVQSMYNAGGGSYAKPTQVNNAGSASASTRPEFNLMNTTGSYFGNQLKNPTYGAMNASMINATPQEKSDYYLQQRNLGYNNADLRTASENTFGKVNEGDWAQMTARAYPTYNQNIVDAYKSIGRSWEQGTIDSPGYNYWMNQVSSGAFDPKNLNSTFAKIAADEAAAKKAHGGSVHELAAKYAYGGQVRTNYQTGGGVSSPGQAAAYYKQRSRDGYTDSEIRAASDNIFGTSSDADWQYIKTIANVDAAPTMSNTGVGSINVAGTSGSYGGSDPYVDPNPAWTNLSNEGKAAYFAANPIEANLNALAIYGFKNTPLGAIQNYFDPNLQQQLLTNLSSNFAPVESRGTALNEVVSSRNQDVQNNDLDAIPGSYTYGGGLMGTLGDQPGDYDGQGGGNTTSIDGGVSDTNSPGADAASAANVGENNARGGRIKTHYQTAGAVRLPSGYGSVDEEEDFNMRFRMQPEAVTSPVNMSMPPKPVIIEPEPVPATVITNAPKSALTKIAVNNARDVDAINAMNESAGTLSVPVVDPAPAPVAAVVVPKAALPGGERMATMRAMLAAYGPKDGAYDAELKTARARATADSDAFTRMLTTSMSSPEDAQSSKAEMYFRLAAAFGAPTKTGQFSENLGMVGKELGEYAKGKRASAREKQLLGLEVQKLKMASSKEDLNTLRALAGKEMDDKRAIATELIKDYIKSGEPQSAAGKQALDEGLKAGTEAYQKRVAEIGNLNVEGKLAQINASIAGMSTQAAMLALAQNKFEQTKDQQAKLTGPEVELKIKTQDMLGSTKQAMDDLKRAYALNDNTFDTSVVDTAQRKLLEAAGSKDPKVLNTREQENLLQKGALAQLKSTFPGAISDAETKTLQALQGLGSKSKEERELIMKNAFRTLQAIEKRSQLRLLEITQGSFRETVPVPQGLE